MKTKKLTKTLKGWTPATMTPRWAIRKMATEAEADGVISKTRRGAEYLNCWDSPPPRRCTITITVEIDDGE